MVLLLHCFGTSAQVIFIKNKFSSQFTLVIYSKSFGCSPVSVTKKVDAIILLPFSSLNLILGT